MRLRARVLFWFYRGLDTFWCTALGSWIYDRCVTDDEYGEYMWEGE